MGRLPTTKPRVPGPQRPWKIYGFFLVSVVFQIYFSYRGDKLLLPAVSFQPKHEPQSNAFWSPQNPVGTDDDDDDDGGGNENENEIEIEIEIEIDEEERKEPREDEPGPQSVDIDNEIQQFPEESREDTISKILGQPGRQKGDDNFLENHIKIQERFMAQKIDDGAGEEALKRTKQTFVDLESDPPIFDDPWFVLHIGPPKTATTTIQCGLERYSLRLAKTDGYHYLGSGCGHEGKEYYMPNGEAGFLRLKTLTGFMNPGSGSYVPRFLDRSKHLREIGRSVVYSSELMASRFGFNRKVMGGLQHMLTDDAGYPLERIKIVLAYRHFVDWLPSYHYQLHATGYGEKGWKTKKNARESRRIKPFLEYVDDYLSKWESYKRLMVNTTDGITGPGLDVLRQRQEQEEEKESTKVDNEKDNSGSNDDDDDKDLSEIDKAAEEEVHNKLLFGFLPEDRRSIHPSWWLYKLWSMYFPLPNQVQVYDMHSPMNSNRPGDDIVTNFVCNMLPHANKTCSKLLLLEDKREGEVKKHPNRTVAATKRNLDASEEPSYDDPQLHPRESLLFVPKKDPNPDSQRSKLIGNSTAGGGGSLNIRQSSDHHAAILVEEMMILGDIKIFNASEYGEIYFSTNPTPPEGLFETFKDITKIAQVFLDENDIRAPNAKYFDCMSKDLEDRLFDASLTFLDLIYKHTQMLTQAAEASMLPSKSSAPKKEAIEEEKERRYNQAKADHSRLFEKNKAKGKYCDVSAEKISKEFPDFYAALSSLSTKPNCQKLKYRSLAPSAKENLNILRFDKLTWDDKKDFELRNKGWESLTPIQKSAAFALGWTPDSWKLEKNVKKAERQRRKRRKAGK